MPYILSIAIEEASVSIEMHSKESQRQKRLKHFSRLVKLRYTPKLWLKMQSSLDVWVVVRYQLELKILRGKSLLRWLIKSPIGEKILFVGCHASYL